MPDHLHLIASGRDESSEAKAFIKVSKQYFRLPVRAGLVSHPAEYPYVGSEVYTLAELLSMCAYGRSAE